MQNNMLVTILTPTYNRAGMLPILYESIKKQLCLDFEWIIVDDGSIDNTSDIVKPWLDETLFSIRYIKQNNGGKHRAVNRGVKEAKGDLLFIVDSDDVLPIDSIAIIKTEYNKIKGNINYCGICGLKAYFTGGKVGGENNYSELECNSLDFRYKYHIKGDVAEVFITDIIKQYPFPEISGEKFCPEDVVWQRIAKKYNFHNFYKKIYLCDYFPDGLTKKITKIRMQSPVASTICYKELTEAVVPLIIKVRASINYWRFWLCPSKERKKCIKPYWIWTLPLGWLMHLNDKIHNNY